MTGLKRLRKLAGSVSGNVWNHMREDYCKAHGLDAKNQGAKFCDELNGIADQIEREQEEMVADSPYDAILPDDRSAIAWVREHGGLEKVKRQRRESIPSEVYERKRRAFLEHIRECETALGKRNAHIKALENKNTQYFCYVSFIKRNGGLEDVARRLMPEGMEWPCFDDGEPVRIGDEYADTFGANTVATIEFGDGYSAINSNTPGGYVVGKFEGAHGRYVPRPAPRVLDADGVEIRVGDTVYGFAGQQYEVTGLCEYESSIVHAKTVGDGVAADELLALSGQLNSAQLEASKITHRAPVLAADGRPLHEGETVWHEEDGTQLRVIGFGDEEDGETIVRVERISGKTDWLECRSLSLNHEQPDSWERWREEWQWPPVKYCKLILGVEYDHDTQLQESFDAQGDDLVRRAKKLAGVE